MNPGSSLSLSPGMNPGSLLNLSLRDEVHC